MFGGGSSALCGLTAGVGVAIPEAGAGVTVVKDEGVDTAVNAYSCACFAWRAAVHENGVAEILGPRVERVQQAQGLQGLW